MIRVLRGVRATKILSSFVLEHRSESAPLAIGLICLLLLVVASASVLHFETDPGSNIKGAEEEIPLRFLDHREPTSRPHPR